MTTLIERIEKFRTFLGGTISPDSLVVYLNPDIISIIWEEYASNVLEIEEMIKLGVINVLKRQPVEKLKSWKNWLYLDSLINYATFLGRIEEMKYLHSVGIHIFPQTFDFASASGNLDIVKWLYSIGIKCTIDSFNWASKNGHLEVLKWLYENMENNVVTVDTSDILISHLRDTTITVIDYAAQSGQIHVLNWLKKNRKDVIISPTGMNWASSNGHLDVIRWIYENEPEIIFTPHNTIDFAAANGHLKVVQYMHIHYARCSEIAINLATINDHKEVVEWLIMNRNECKYGANLGYI